MKYVGMQSSIWSNRVKTTFLLLAFPLLVFWLVFLIFYFFVGDIPVGYSTPKWLYVLSFTLDVFSWVWPLILVIGIISFFLQRQLIFSFSGARKVERNEYPQIYNIIENFCIEKGLPMPKIGIIDSSALNAFALGWKPENAWIVFTTGLLKTLDKREIEAVAGHEFTHILNKDSLIMTLIVVYVWAILTLGQIFIRMRNRNSNGKGSILPLVGLVFLLLGYLILPLFRLAISRRREYLADAGSVELTKDNRSMISALQKISGHSHVVSIKNEWVAAMCIDSTADEFTPLQTPPLGGEKLSYGSEPYSHKKRSWVKNIFSTHPSIEDRIEALRYYE